MSIRTPKIRLLALLTALAALVVAPAARAERPAAYLYASANGSSAVDAYAAGADGALTALGAPSPAGGRPAGLALSPDGRDLYVANQVAGTVSQFAVADDGTLTPTGAAVPAGEAPFGIAAAPDGRHVFVTDRAAGEVRVFGVGAHGALTPASSAAAGDGAASIALSRDGASAYVANFAAGTVSQFAVAADGTLRPRVPAAVPAGAAPFALAVAPDGASLYVTDQSARGFVRQFDVNASGALAPKATAAIATGGSPAGLVAARGAVYVANFADRTISQYDAGPDGSLRPRAVPTVPAGLNPWALALAPDGRSLYASNYGDATLSQYDVGDDGALAPKAEPTVASGTRPIALAVRAAPDATAPTVDLVTPAEGDTYAPDEVVLADFTCADEGPSGLESCEGTVPDGEAVDTSTSGEHEFTVLARDGAGNETRVVHRYWVTEAPPQPSEPSWAGFAWPVRELPATNSAWAGGPVTVRFRLDGADGTDPADILADGSPGSTQVDCDDPGAPDAGEPAASVDDRGLRWRRDAFQFKWATDPAWAGTCRMLLVTLRDGSVHRALYAFDSVSWGD